MQARMTLGTRPAGGKMKMEELKEMVEECERMGWEAHIEHNGGNDWSIVFTRELGKEGTQ